MDDITNIQDDNLGGLQLIKFAPLRFFQSVTPVVFNAGCDWITVACTPESIVFNESTGSDENGDYQTITITARVPKIRPDVHAALQKYRLQKMIVVCTDNNDYLRLAGTLDEGLELSDTSTTGAQASDPNGYNLQFNGTQLQTALFI